MSQNRMLFGEAPAGRYRLRDDSGRIGNPGEAIFPIFAEEPGNRCRSIGTGFFIANFGLFVTAAHVLDASLDSKGNFTRPMFMIQTLPDDRILPRRIVQTCTHPVADVAIGLLQGAVHKSGNGVGNKTLALSHSSSFEGERICTYAYPKTLVGEGERPDVDLEPGYFDGRTVKDLPNGRDSVMMKGACYQTTMALHGGASGGPVFNARGKVFAINSTGYDDDYLSYVSCASALIDLFLENVRIDAEPERRRVTFRELLDRRLVISE